VISFLKKSIHLTLVGLLDPTLGCRGRANTSTKMVFCRY